jgi:hypothetical protein
LHREQSFFPAGTGPLYFVFNNSITGDRIYQEMITPRVHFLLGPEVISLSGSPELGYENNIGITYSNASRNEFWEK